MTTKTIGRLIYIMAGMGICLLIFTVWGVLQVRRDGAAIIQETPQQYVIRTASNANAMLPIEVPCIMTALAPPTKIGNTDFGMLAIGTDDRPREGYSAIARMSAGIKKGDRVKIVELVYTKRHNYDYDTTHLRDSQLDEYVFLAEPIEATSH